MTEGSLLDDPTAVHATLERLRAFGVGDELAVDQMADGLGHVVIVLHGLGVKWASSAYPENASSYQN